MTDPGEGSKKTAGPGKAFWLNAREILDRGENALTAVESLDEFRELDRAERHKVLQHRRTEMYAIASLIADSTVDRALQARSSFPPFGLARSMFSEFRIIADRPEPVTAEYIDGFFRLGRACIDTMVFHLDAEIQHMRQSQRAWMHERLARVLALFAEGATDEVRARMRDPFSFMYGGLQFGVSTIVQFLEAMNRKLEEFLELPPRKKAEIMRRSVRPIHQLSSINVEKIVPAYTRLQPDPGTVGKSAPAGWMDPARLTVEKLGEDPRRIILRDDGEVLGADVEEGSYPTQGCPARVSPMGGASAISLLWAWFIDLAETTGLLDGSPAR